MNSEIKHWIVEDVEVVENCNVCGRKLELVPYSKHPLSRVWNRIKPGEMIMCCPNNCLEGQDKIKVKILRPEQPKIEEHESI
jgi:hypothetical protein